jgi:hypothetical protein
MTGRAVLLAVLAAWLTVDLALIGIFHWAVTRWPPR